MKKVLRIVLTGLVSLLLLLFLLPYAFSVPDYVPASNYKPFPESHFTTIKGVSIHYREWKPAADNSKGNILFIHGFSGSTFSWRKNIDTLVAQDYHVVAVDVPPFGYSSKQKNVNHSMSANANLLWKLADSLSNKVWILTGHSMGAGIAGAMAAMSPEKTDKLILVDGTFNGTVQSEGSGFTSLLISSGPVKQLASVIASNYYYTFPKFKKLLASAYSQEPDSLAVAGYLEPFTIKRTTAAILELSRSYEIQSLSLSSIKAPVLLIWGSKDKWIPIDAAQSFIKKMPAVQYSVIEGAGHCPMETHATEFNRLLIKFIDQTP